MAKKWFEVTVVAASTVLVHAEDEDQANEVAYDAAFSNDAYYHKETKESKEIEQELVDSALRHACIVVRK